MRIFRMIIVIQLILFLVSCNNAPNMNSSESKSIEATDKEKAEKDLVNKIMGRWFSTEDNQFFLDLKDNIEITGIEESVKYTQGEFIIEEVNVQDQYIVVQSFIEELSEENEDHLKEESRNKLELLENGNKLKYNFNFEKQNIQSEWIR
ncbi:hypothetical protein ACFPPD_18270 [Cohnella suwonensis]|uniref:Lipoprotein n=1 Tax=Cohnella suwonensis TaxID=696072 RepID=A0ABW0LY47_9BACL